MTSESQDSYPVYAAQGESESLDEFLESIDGLSFSLIGELEHLTLEDEEDDQDDQDDDEMPTLGKLREMVLVCLKHHNSSSSQENLEFLRIEKAERFQACGGYIYSLTLRVKNNQGEQRTIQKMVWLGELFEPLHVEEKKSSQEESHDQTQQQLTDYLQQLLGNAVAMGHSVYLYVNRVISANANSNSSGRITHGEGYIKFSNYDVTAVARGNSDEYEVLLQGVVRRSKWVLPLNKDITNSLLSWATTTATIGDPPLILPYGSPDIRKYKRPQYLNQLDLTSPQILTQALFALENYNFNKGSNLEFSKVERASRNRTMGIDYKLFISVKVGQSYQIFTTEVWEFADTNFWKCISPFKQIQGTLGPLEQVDHPRMDM